jgi:hypothetical protein
MIGTDTSRGTEFARACDCGLGGCGCGRGNEEEETFLGDFGGGEGGPARGRSSGIGILLRCTVRLDGGVYAFGGSSSLMRCSPPDVCASYITYWCSSSDRLPAVTSAKINKIG